MRIPVVLVLPMVLAAQVATFDSSKVYPGSQVSRLVGSVTIADQTNVVNFTVSLQGFTANEGATVYIHTGLSCSRTDLMGGFFFRPFNGSNPYPSAASFSADAQGNVSTSFVVATGYAAAALLGHALTLHAGETGLACALILPSFSPLSVPLRPFPDTNPMNTSGLVSLYEPEKGRIRVNYMVKGLDADSSGGMFIAKEIECASATPLWKKDTDPSPWVEKYLSNSRGEAEGAFDISEESLGYPLNELTGHAFALLDRNGATTACGYLPAETVIPEEVNHGNWMLGVLCSTLASFGTVIGMLLQKWSHMQEQLKPDASKKHVMKRPLWWLSLFFMILVPAPLDIAAFGLASQSLLAPLSGITLLLNAVFAPLVLKEKVTRRDMFASVLITIGAGITTVFGAHTQTQYTVPTLYILFSRPGWIFFQVLANLGVVFLWLSVKTGLGKLPARLPVPPERVQQFCKAWLVYLIALLVALSGAQQMVFTKTVSELIVESIDGEVQFIYFMTYILIALAIGYAVFQIGYLNKGLELYDAVYFLPLYNAGLIVLCIIVGAVYFDEIAHVTWLQIFLFVVGVSICLIGVLLLKKRPSTLDKEANKQALMLEDGLEQEQSPAKIYTNSDL